ncbi:cysteine sulfinic acid decarboxylase [Condylostylus longicornis]|uniref:cysteine sulfinic acid decarboxylase n=1 Tax=Condylostylus longicornis TaxID=2530218 RepID=UPI00244E15C9|nr:cysteine sulfinic acid decarboxylase [Condylostylus longicornis]
MSSSLNVEIANDSDNIIKLEAIKSALTNDWKFLKEIYDLLLEGNVFPENIKNGFSGCGNHKIVDYICPSELKKKIDLKIDNSSKSSSFYETNNYENIKDILKDVIKYSVKTNHPYFRNQLFGQLDPFGLAGTWISEALNTSTYTFEVAPVFSLIETEIIQTFCKFFQFQNGDGIFAPGGSISNMYSIVLARYKKFPETKTKGLFGLPPLVIFTSEESHYSIKKACNWLGFGYNNCITIKTNKFGQMLVADLEEKILEAKNEHKIPFYVNATAGSTVLGAFDNLEEISDVCKKYDLWLHVDACLGGAAILSKKHKNLLNSVSKVNSISWNPHKSLGAPLQCSLFLVNGKEIMTNGDVNHEHTDSDSSTTSLLSQCNAIEVKYLFQQDKYYDVSYDTGNKSIQCGRKIDAFKFWVMLKARGLTSFETLIDNALDIANKFYIKIKNRPGFRLVQEKFQYTNVCFWYIPKNMRNQPENENWWKIINTVAPKIKEKMIMSGTMMVGYTPLPYRNLGNFIRMAFTCFPVLNENDIEFLINEIENLGEQICL